MHPPERRTKGLAAHLTLLVLACWGFATGAHAMPGFSRQTGQPCVACHVGPVGSPLGPFGRQLTLDYAATDSGQPWRAMILPVSFTLMTAGRASGPVGTDIPDVAATEPGTARNPWNTLPGWSFPYPLTAPVLTGEQMRSPDRPADQSPDLRFTGFTGAAASASEPASGPPWIDGVGPYWRVVLQKNLERHFPRNGSYEVRFADDPPAGEASGYMSTAASASYRFTIDPDNDLSDSLSARATIIQERRPGAANIVLPGNDGMHALDAFRADASFNFANAITPSIQYFRTEGAMGAMQYGWPGSRPNTAGLIAEVAYVPWAKTDSTMRFLNLRFAAQYVAYTEFNSATHGPGGNNAVYLSLWGALRF